MIIRFFKNNYKSLPIVIQLLVAWMWNCFLLKKLENVQEMFFYVSGVLDPERFFNKLSALKNSLFSSSKLRKPDSVTSKTEGTVRKMVFCSSFVPKWSVKLCRFQAQEKKERNSNLSSKIQSPYKTFSCRAYLLIYRGASIEKIVEIITNNPTLLWGGLSLPPWSGRSKKLSWYKTTSPNDKRMATEDQIVDFLLTTYRSFVHATILMRLLLHRWEILALGANCNVSERDGRARKRGLTRLLCSRAHIHHFPSHSNNFHAG